jgi:hypothetical protein
MTPNDFCYWLQGFLEISDIKTLTPKQLLVIKDHLGLVFEKKTPLRFGPTVVPYTLCEKGGGIGGTGNYGSTYVGSEVKALETFTVGGFDGKGNKITGPYLTC